MVQTPKLFVSADLPDEFQGSQEMGLEHHYSLKADGTGSKWTLR